VCKHFGDVTSCQFVLFTLQLWAMQRVAGTSRFICKPRSVALSAVLNINVETACTHLLTLVWQVRCQEGATPLASWDQKPGHCICGAAGSTRSAAREQGRQAKQTSDHHSAIAEHSNFASSNLACPTSHYHAHHILVVHCLSLLDAAANDQQSGNVFAKTFLKLSGLSLIDRGEQILKLC
jgi:hypothetical protein